MECPLTSNYRLLPRTPSCLNPCSNGMPSDIRPFEQMDIQFFVLILVLMECPLTYQNKSNMIRINVLILVLMECPLTQMSNIGDALTIVLILVLMECPLTKLWRIKLSLSMS